MIFSKLKFDFWKYIFSLPFIGLNAQKNEKPSIITIVTK